MMEWFLSLALIIVPRGLLARNGDNKNASCELDYKQTRVSFAFEFGAGKCGKTLTQLKQKHFFNHCDCFHNFNYVILEQIVRQNVMSLISTIIFTTQLYFMVIGHLVSTYRCFGNNKILLSSKTKTVLVLLCVSVQ
jgi:hypothetical protein